MSAPQIGSGMMISWTMVRPVSPSVSIYFETRSLVKVKLIDACAAKDGVVVYAMNISSAVF